MSLRSKTIKLAHDNPELRPHLLPILKTAQPVVVVGDIFVSSWGYDQTNIDFYEVIKTTGKMAIIRKLEKKIVKRSVPNEYVMPVKGRYAGAPLRKKIQEYSGKPKFKINSYANAYPWSGKPEASTMSQYGH